MIVTGGWVLPISGAPIREGAVLVRQTRIVEVGTAAEVIARNPSEPVERHPDCVIVPGFVNAHTHLSLTILRGLLPDVPLVPWLKAVTTAAREMSADDHAVSAALGAVESLQSGVTSVGDIGYGPESMAACADVGVGGVFFWEILGIDASMLASELASREFPTKDESFRGRARVGISPHTAFTSGPELLRAVRAIARTHGMSLAIHVAESEAERELMRRGTGPLAASAARLAHGFVAPRSSAVAYLDRLGVLEDAVAVHCVHLDAGDANTLRRSARGVVLCPRSNERLGNGLPPVSELLVAGNRLALGTDSAASNDDLDLLAEARRLRAVAPTIPATRMLRMLTLGGAEVLGIADAVGSLEPEKYADLALVRTAPTDHPEEAVLADDGSVRVVSVLAQGTWRVRDSCAVASTGKLEQSAERARARIARALGSGESR